MKVFGLITMLTVLASCGGSGGGSSANQSRKIDPVTADKFEQAIRSQKAGMVEISAENGSYVDLTFNSITGKYDSKIATEKHLNRDTILKIDGDIMYTLSESFEDGQAEPVSREVRMESLTEMVKDITEPMPPGTEIVINGNKMSLKFNFNYTNDLSMGTGHTITQTVNTTANTSINLDNIRCSQMTNAVSTNSITQDGVVSKLPTTTSTNSTTCGATLTKTQLQALNLKNIRLCDETSGDDEAEIECHVEADLSSLVN